MNDFLIDCSFKPYSMGPKFGQFIQGYVTLSRAMPHRAGPHIFITFSANSQRYSKIF
jgi:hypothetical protein